MSAKYSRLMRCLAVGALFTLGAQGGAFAASVAVTGVPSADGWNYYGYSLDEGVYVKGGANYGYDVYNATIRIKATSNLLISDDDYSWLENDMVAAVGGVFRTDTPDGWGTGTPITGNDVNSLLSVIPNDSSKNGPKLQAKFGTDAATWTTSTTAPDGGNGNSSSGSGGGSILVRTTAYNNSAAGDWLPGGVLTLPSTLTWSNGTLSNNVARIIWGGG